MHGPGEGRIKNHRDAGTDGDHDHHPVQVGDQTQEIAEDRRCTQTDKHVHTHSYIHTDTHTCIHTQMHARPTPTHTHTNRSVGQHMRHTHTTNRHMTKNTKTHTQTHTHTHTQTRTHRKHTPTCIPLLFQQASSLR